MPKKILTLTLLLFALSATAQKHRADTLNERLFEAKVREMVYRLNITDDQKPKFVPIYRRYSEEMIAAWGDHQPPSRPTTPQEAANIEKRRMERQQRAQAIRIKYVDEFATVLNARQLSRFFEVESDIQKKLQARRRHAGRSHGKGSPRSHSQR